MQLILHLNARFQPKHRFELEDALQDILIGHSYGTYIVALSVAQQPDLFRHM